MSTLTPNYSFFLPAVNDPVDANLWGGELNTNFSNLDTDLKAVSDTATAAAAGTFAGEMKAYAGISIPALWLECNGAAIDRTTYAILFAAIGTTWGSGNGTTTFNLPDMGGRVPAGKEAVAARLTSGVSGVDGALLGATGGEQNMQLHTHVASVTDPGHAHGFTSITPGASFTGGYATAATTASQSTSNVVTGISVSNANAGSGASQNVQPTAVVHWLIYAGV